MNYEPITIKREEREMKFYWNARMKHWRVYGVWIKEKWFVGFSIVTPTESESSDE